jgi:hypothetical protein
MRSERGKNLFFLWVILVMLFLWPGDMLSKESDGRRVGEGQGKVTFLQGKAGLVKGGNGMETFESWKSPFPR